MKTESLHENISEAGSEEDEVIPVYGDDLLASVDQVYDDNIPSSDVASTVYKSPAESLAPLVHLQGAQSLAPWQLPPPGPPDETQ
eukprot:gene22932-30112_t